MHAAVTFQDRPQKVMGFLSASAELVTITTIGLTVCVFDSLSLSATLAVHVVACCTCVAFGTAAGSGQCSITSAFRQAETDSILANFCIAFLSRLHLLHIYGFRYRLQSLLFTSMSHSASFSGGHG